MKQSFKKIISVLGLSLLIGLFLVFELKQNNPDETRLQKDLPYSSKEDVSLYIHLYKELPPNYITKKEAMALGWQASKGNLWDVSDKLSIGGDAFGNREKQLPEKQNRKYYEADIDYEGGFRNEKRLVYSNDGLIYYTADHYQHFEKLYGDE